MSNVAYVKVFLSWVDETRKLKDAEKGRLIDAMVAYAMGDTDIDSRLTGNEAYVFPIFQARLDRDMAEFRNRSKANSQNGSKGGAPLGNSNAKSNQDKPIQAKTSRAIPNSPKIRDFPERPTAKVGLCIGGTLLQAKNLRRVS